MLDLGDRMKDYESPAAQTLMQRTPLIIRVDGKAFHSVTANLDRPSQLFMDTMAEAAELTALEMHGFKIAYVQGDEASFFLTDYDTHTTEAYMGLDLRKLISIPASTMTYFFIMRMAANGLAPYLNTPIAFDGRAFNVPRDEVANYFLWRCKDWERNSVNMYARSFFSEKQMHGKRREEKHEMLHSIGKNWATDLNDQGKNGTFIIRGQERLRNTTWRYDVQPNYESVNEVVNPWVYLDKSDYS